MAVDPPGGPIKLIAIPPCPPESSALLTLPISAIVFETATEEQRARIAKIQVDFAQRVSRVLLRSYGEIAEIFGGEVRTPRKRTEPPE